MKFLFQIGTPDEKYPIVLKEYMSYDEIKIAALLNISSESYFINNGARDNQGKLGIEGTFNPHGVIVGQVGARFKKPDVMEWQDCIITRTQNVENNGYGIHPPNNLPRLWSSLWKESLPTWEEANNIKGEDFMPLYDKKQGGNNIFNVKVFKKRIQLTAKTLLIDARNRAQAFGKKAYIHVVGLGLGVWRISKHQEAMYVEAWGEALKTVDTSNVGHIDFSWISHYNCLGTKDGQKFPGTDVIIHFSKRALHDPVPEGTFLICNFAWDGNSLPGNEYWTFKTKSTGDSAAASSSCVAELHNHYINEMVTAENLHIATRNGVYHISEYAKFYIENKLNKLSSQNYNDQSSVHKSHIDLTYFPLSKAKSHLDDDKMIIDADSKNIIDADSQVSSNSIAKVSSNNEVCSQSELDNKKDTEIHNIIKVSKMEVNSNTSTRKSESIVSDSENEDKQNTSKPKKKSKNKKKKGPKTKIVIEDDIDVIDFSNMDKELDNSNQVSSSKSSSHNTKNKNKKKK